MPLTRSIIRRVRGLLLEQLSPCLVLLDQEGRIIEVRGSAEHYGFGPLAPGDAAAEAMPFIYGLVPGEGLHLPFVATPNDRTADLRVLAVEGATAVLLTDVTAEHRERRAAQQQANEVRLLNLHQQRLLGELREARDALEQRHREAETLSLMKSRFIARLSHELRTPLSGIIGHAGLLGERFAGDPEAVAGLRAIQSGAAHLLALVDDILDQAGIESGQIALAPAATRLQELLDDLDAMCRPIALAKGLDFQLGRGPGLPPWVQADATRLRQVIINLVTNAIQYTPKGFAALDVGWDQGVLEVRVSDTGPGVPPEARERILLPFQRGEGARAQRGLGLGLAISAQLIGLMGGRLSIADRPGGGSVFGFRVPMTALDGPRPTPGPGPQRRLLLVDDAPDVRLLYTRLLEKAGYRVVAVADQGAALAALAQPPDAVIADLYLDAADGSELIGALRGGGYGGAIIAWSSSSLGGDRDRAMQAGADAYLVKPVAPAVLCAALDELLDRGGGSGRTGAGPEAG